MFQVVFDFVGSMWDWLVARVYAVGESAASWVFGQLPTEWVDFVSGKNPLTGSPWWSAVSESFYMFNSVFPLKETFIIFGMAIGVVAAVRMVKLVFKLSSFVLR